VLTMPLAAAIELFLILLLPCIRRYRTRPRAPDGAPDPAWLAWRHRHLAGDRLFHPVPGGAYLFGSGSSRRFLRIGAAAVSLLAITTSRG
jgi:hypothetical protein